MKKLKYLILIPALFLIFSLNVKALDCEYSDGKLTTTFTIKESNGEVGNAIVNGELKSTDETNIKNESMSIENWDTIFDPSFDSTVINARGIDYYNGYKQCPPYAIFVDRQGQFDLAVSTESHLTEFRTYGESKQGYAIMKLVNSRSAAEGGGGGTSVRDSGSSCASYTNEKDCTNSNVFSCIWNETEYGGYCNTDNLTYVQCGDSFDIPSQEPTIISLIVNLLKIGTPIVLIIVGMITLVKALTAAKEDEITKAKNSLVKKIIAAVIIFLITAIVQFVISLATNDETEANNFSACLDCFLNNNCSSNTYYKTNVGGTYLCTYIDGTSFSCKENK